MFRLYHHALSVNKYSRRAWDMQEIMWPEEKRINHPVWKYRQLGDRFTWTIPVDSKKLEWSKTPDYVLKYASFRMVSNHEYPGLDERYIDYQHPQEQHVGPRCYGIDAITFVGRTLKHRYLRPGHEYELECFLGVRVDQSTQLEELSKRPLNYDQLIQNPHDLYRHIDYERPETWTYRADDFPGWYQA